MKQVSHMTWQKSKPPGEAELRYVMLADGMDPKRWSHLAGEGHPAHSHEYHTAIYCVEGAMTFTILDENNRRIDMHPGDRLEIPAGVRHVAVAGADGGAYLEGRR